MNRVEIQKGSVSEIFADLKNDWQTLFAAAGCSPFLSWEWMTVWFESFGEGKVPFVLKAFRDDNLIGIMPMLLDKKTILGMRFDRLSFIGEQSGGADYLDVIAKPGNKSDAISAILDFLQSKDYCDLVRLESMAGDSETIDILKDLSRKTNGRLPHLSESTAAVCPQIDLTGGWEAVLSNSKRTVNFKRKLKKLEKMSGFEYRSITSPHETGAAFERFLSLHEKRWEKDGGSEMSGHPRLVSFHRRLVPEISRAGLIRFDELWVEGECRSSIYGLGDGQTFYLYNTGYDIELPQLSVGLVLLGLSIKNAIERGNTLYDFLRGDETYKFDWANRSINLVNVSLSRNTAVVIAVEGIGKAFRGLRNTAKHALPSGVAGSLANWRRGWKRNYQLSDR